MLSVSAGCGWKEKCEVLQVGRCRCMLGSVCYVCLCEVCVCVYVFIRNCMICIYICTYVCTCVCVVSLGLCKTLVALHLCRSVCLTTLVGHG